ncbi:YugE family protein [Bhargavaea cecembensis]|uniref:YugE family protein n=1 Tax=Bhargavaea cecembensis TaxID=394098 RepID=UPI00211D7493|nr:YugE family protein [Bhargavaea cecembensis]
MNRFAADFLKQWDPLGQGEDAYDEEIADVIAALHETGHPSELANRIRLIYEHSHEFWIPLESCMDIAYKLIALKYGVVCPA